MKFLLIKNKKTKKTKKQKQKQKQKIKKDESLYKSKGSMK
jgi:hypothetical protein